MTTLIEAMARAYAVAREQDPDEPVAWDLSKPKGERIAKRRWENYATTAQDFLTALQESGYVVVPVEPTDQMVEAGEQVIADFGDPGATGNAEKVFRAMLKSAQGEG